MKIFKGYLGGIPLSNRCTYASQIFQNSAGVIIVGFLRRTLKNLYRRSAAHCFCFNECPQNKVVIYIPDLCFGPIFLCRDGNQFQGKQRDGKKFVQRCQPVREFLVEYSFHFVHILFIDQIATTLVVWSVNEATREKQEQSIV